MRGAPGALLALEDGSTFLGRSLGAGGEAFGEAVFNTAMTGYQEVLTDPSYARQIVVMTYPHQGNYGVNGDDPESDRVQAAGLVVREAARRPTGWRAERSLLEELEAAGVVGIEDVDTRAVTLRIREGGAMRAAISTEDLDPASLVARVREAPGMLGADLAREVSTPHPYEVLYEVPHQVPYEAPHASPPRPSGRQTNARLGTGGRPLRVAAYDWGLKRNILRRLAAAGCRVTVLPADFPAEEVMAGGFDGVFLSNGPGDPAATTDAIRVARALLGRIPVFGICLGHQIVALAAGGRTYKLKFGHRGANQPVRDLDTGRVEVTSHNHGFAVDPGGWGRAAPAPASRSSAAPASGSPPGSGDGPPLDAPPVVDTAFGPAALTHWNLNDGTLEGLRFLSIPAFTVQYHPEAAPGPHDSGHLFGRFVALMGGPSAEGG